MENLETEQTSLFEQSLQNIINQLSNEENKKPVLEEEFELLSSGYGTTIHDKDNTKFVILINDNEPLTLFHELLHTAIRVEPFMKQYYEDMK